MMKKMVMMMTMMMTLCVPCRYVRCLKPNGKKQPNDYQPTEVLQQLRYSGMLDIIRIKREVGRPPGPSFMYPT